MSATTFNPELARNFRIQLRPGRMLAAAVICAAVSLSFVAVYSFSGTRDPRQLFGTIFLIQTAVLVIGGSIYCLQSVQREKDQNTFDFQRITRLTPLQLAIGKILGAPALAYFVVLCLMPVVFWAAPAGGVGLLTILEMYVVLLLGALVFHCFAVLISMVLQKGTSAGAMFFFLWAIGMTSIEGNGNQQGLLAVHAIGPFWPYTLLESGTSSIGSLPPPPLDLPYVTGPTTDLFFSVSVPHAAVLLVLYATLAAWFLLALARNIKRDPSVYEIYRPWQSFALALYLNFLVLGFFRWTMGTFVQTQGARRPGDGSWQFYPVSAQDAESSFLAASLAIFLFLGLTLLRNRERTRRFLREFGKSSADWLAAVWPAPYLIGGAALTGIASVALIHLRAQPGTQWDLGVGVLQVAFAAVWLARDFVYLQWMNLRRTRRPLVSAFLYLIVFYVCVSIVLSTLHLFDAASKSIAAIFVPSAAIGLDSATWSAHQAQWIGSLVLLFVQMLGFAWLQRRELKQLAATGSAAEPVTP